MKGWCFIAGSCERCVHCSSLEDDFIRRKERKKGKGDVVCSSLYSSEKSRLEMGVMYSIWSVNFSARIESYDGRSKTRCK